MKAIGIKSTIAVIFLLIFTNCDQSKISTTKLKDALKNDFYIGAALNNMQVLGNDSLVDAVITQNFNSIVAENCMKSENIQPVEGEFFFDDADRFVSFGEKNNMFIIGHCLVWHSQAPKWFFTNNEGDNVSREVLIERMKAHIKTLVGRYKDRVNGWDVVNEAINDDGTYRNTMFYQIIGEDYIQLAFEFAHEADPNAELYYNDYNLYKPEKKRAVIDLVKSLQNEGVKITGIGMQAHCGLNTPSIDEYEASIIAFSELKVKVMFTELDISVIPFPSQELTAEIATNFELKKELDPYPNGLPDSVNIALAERYKAIFAMLIRNNDKISRVTTWGVSDVDSWRNNWPVKGRTDYPLLFDRNYRPKLAVEKIIELKTLE